MRFTTFANITNRSQMKLIVVTPPKFFIEEDKIITALFEEGLDLLHIRKPETSAMYCERLLTLIPKKYHKRIVTHEHFYLKEEFELMGIHLNRRNCNEPHDYSGHVSTTCRSLEELQNKKHFYDYVFVKPLFENQSKVNFSNSFPAETIREMKKKKLIDHNVMAAGGITSKNILLVKELGFGGAVIMSDLWEKFDAQNDYNYLKVINYFKQLKKMVD